MASSFSMVVLDIEMTVLKVIDNLPFCHCVAWNGYFRNQWKPFLTEYLVSTNDNTSLDLKQAGIRAVPLENGVRRYEAEQHIVLRLVFSENLVSKSRMYEMLAFLTQEGNCNRKNEFKYPHFSSESVMLSRACCAICGEDWNSAHQCTINQQAIATQTEALTGKPLKIVFYTPLIQKRLVLANDKQPSRPFVDPEFLSTELGCSRTESGFASLVWGQKKRAKNSSQKQKTLAQYPAVLEKAGTIWMKTEYKRPEPNLFMSFNGLLGSLVLEPTENTDFLHSLVLGYFTGVGNSVAMGFGAYEIFIQGTSAEKPSWINALTICRNGKRCTSLLRSGLNIGLVRQLAKELPLYENTQDTEKAYDIISAPDSWYVRFLDDLYEANFGQRKLFPYTIRLGTKKRSLYLSNARDHLAQKAVLEVLQASADTEVHPLFKTAVYAYRKGVGYHKAVQATHEAMSAGAVYGWKVDIANFFETISRAQLFFIIEALWQKDTTLDYITDWFSFLDTKRVRGLPQGSPLSPLLSNLFLLSLDDEMERICKKGNRTHGVYIRYSDDIILLHNNKEESIGLLRVCEAWCAKLGLSLKKDKRTEITPTDSFIFLGYKFEGGKPPEQIAKSPEPWKIFSCRSYTRGIALYLTGLVKRILVNKNYLTVEYKKTVEESKPEDNPSVDEENNKPARKNYAWKELSRIVILAGCPGSSMLIEQALQKQISLAFINYHGDLSGMFLPEHIIDSTLSEKQSLRFANKDFRLSAAKSIIHSKIITHINSINNWNTDAQHWQVVKQSCLKDLQQRLCDVKAVDNEQSLLGIEVTAARAYYKAFSMMCLPFVFEGRTYRPPKGEINTMLSFGYTLLYARTAAAIKANGLLPHVGVFHLPHGAHMVLVSDLMEPLRFIVDRTTVKLIQDGKIKPEHFIARNDDPSIFRMDWEFRNIFIRAFESSFSEIEYNLKGFSNREASWILEENIRKMLAAIRLESDFECLELLV